MTTCTLDTKASDINLDEFIQNIGSTNTPIPNDSVIDEYIKRITTHLSSCDCQNGKLCISSFGQDPVTKKDIVAKLESFNPSDPLPIINYIKSIYKDKHRNVCMSLVLYGDVKDPKSRGTRKDIISVFGIGAEFDDKDAGKYLERLPKMPDFVFESSEGRYHCHYYFKTPISPDEAEIIAKALTEYSNCDPASKDVHKAWRIPGSLNCPNHKKCMKEGRPETPYTTRVVQAFSDYTDPQELKESLKDTIKRLSQKKEKKELSVNDYKTVSSENSYIWDGQDIETLPIAKETKDLILYGVPEGQRSEAMMTVMNGLAYANCTDEQIFQIFEQYSIGEKYREKGSDPEWLKPQIDKAKRWATDRAKKKKTDSDDVIYPLFGEFGKGLDFPVDALPKVIADAAYCIHESLKAPMPLICHCMLASISSAIQPHINVEIDGRISPVNNFYASVADSGERKSAIDRIVQKPISDKQKKEIEEYDKNKIVNRALHNSWKKKVEAAENEKDPETIRQAVLAAGEEPKLILPIYIMDDPTYQSVIKRFLDGRYSLTLNTPEGGQFIGGYSMSKENKAATISGLSKFWDGDGVSKNLSESIQQVYDRRFGLNIMFQPVFSESFFSDSLSLSQGFLSRFLSCYPASTIGERPYSERDVTQDERTIRFYSCINDILDLKLPLNENKTGLEPRNITLSPEAKKIWIDFHNEVESAQKKKGELYDIRGFASKAPEHALREAAKINFFCDREAETISLDNMEAGINILKFYLSEALRLFNSDSIHPILKDAQKVYEWGMKPPRNGRITLIQIYQGGLRCARGKRKAEKLMGILESHNMAVKIEKSRPATWHLRE